MSENKYPAIFQPDYDSEIKVLVYGQYDGVNAIHLDGKHKGAKTKYTIHGSLKNITREYLMNTYGKCESQEHVDFICKLAENHGFELNKDYIYGKYFYISATKYGFSDNEFFAMDGARLITLPLPPKEKEMPEEKPVYTKEMYERGELPPVGSEVLTVSGIGVVHHHILVVAIGEQEFFIKSTDVNPPPTIEDELFDITSRFIGREMTQADLVCELLDRYNITPKEK